MAEGTAKFEGVEEMRMAEWLEMKLKQYVADTLRRKSDGKVSLTVQQIKKFPLIITSLHYCSKRACFDDVEKENLNHTISDIFITYCFCKEITLRELSLLSKSTKVICNGKTDKDLDLISAARIHEINFYTKLVPDLEDWALFEGLTVTKLPWPTCYYGKCECTREQNEDTKIRNYLETMGLRYTFLFTVYNNVGSFLKGFRKSPGHYEMNTVLLLENLTKLGFKESSSPFGLTLEETEMAVKKIAQVHALSYAWEVKNRMELAEQWNIFLKPKDIINIFTESVTAGLSVGQKLLKDRVSIIDALNKLQTQIRKRITRLLELTDYALPNTIIHLNLSPGNIFFLPEVEVETNSAAKTENIERYSQVDGSDCEQGDFGENDNNFTAVAKIRIKLVKDCVFIGWSKCIVGPCLHDVAILLLSAFPPEIRRRNVTKILQIYYYHFKIICSALKVKVPFEFSLLSDAFSHSLLFAVLLEFRKFSDPVQKIDPDYLQNFVAAVEDLIELKVI